MKLRIPQALNEIGQRHNQEDSIFPRKGEADESSRLFLVCDGMGGHENGEVASGLVCSTFGSMLSNVDHDRFTVEDFEQALSAAYDALDREDPNPESMRKMGTTLTFLHLGERDVVVAHMGDSRVYHIRPSSSQPILYQSSDHSLVNELVRAEIITPEEALTHPRRNVITRALQPNLETRHKADVRCFNDVMAGDYFFLCSDGVLESVTNDALVDVLRREVSDSEKIEVIKALCEASSRDNFSAYLVPIAEGLPEVVANVVEAELADDGYAEVVEGGVQSDANAARPVNHASFEKPKSPFRLTPMNIILACIALLAVCATIYFAISHTKITIQTHVTRSGSFVEQGRVSDPCSVEEVSDIIKGDAEVEPATENAETGVGGADVSDGGSSPREIVAPEGDGPSATDEGRGATGGVLLNGQS